MAEYQSILTVKIYHEYYNSYKEELAPLTLSPDKDTDVLFRKLGIIFKQRSGFLQLVVDTESFIDSVDDIQGVNMMFYLISGDPVTRSITQMPGMFDIANLTVDFTDTSELTIPADNWIEISQLNENPAYRGIENCSKNLISIVTIHLPKKISCRKARA
ncbi:MAG: hypothetical protein XXXJIFNMEKO3_02228 [Candidatus Erwinia impunctatus]|nr:hypothetical protein XXXJIFNMEKO_02228 [Culicoides impunctatus]